MMTDKIQNKDKGKSINDILHEHLLTSYTTNGDYNNGYEKCADSY